MAGGLAGWGDFPRRRISSNVTPEHLYLDVQAASTVITTL